MYQNTVLNFKTYHNQQLHIISPLKSVKPIQLLRLCTFFDGRLCLMEYFKSVSNLSELRKQYKELLKKHHPDNGGDVADMQGINSEYDSLFKKLKEKHDSKGADSNKASFGNMQYDFAEDEKLREMLGKIIGFSGITLEVIGNWLWAFDSYDYRKELKELGFRYAKNKKAWYWHSESFRKKSRKSLSMDDIRSYYDSTEVRAQRELLEA